MPTLLVIDDDPVIAETIGSLMPAAWTVLAALDGLAGLDIVRQRVSDHCPLEILNVVRFNDAGGATEIVLEAQPFGATAEEQAFFDEIRPSMVEGNRGMFGQLATYLAGE